MFTPNTEVGLYDPKNWSTEDEVRLLYCTLDNKPVGIDKHFQMSIIWKKFVSSSKKSISSDVLWKKLGSWYNLKKLDEFEGIPLKLDDEDFQLPAEIIPDNMLKNLLDDEKKYIDTSGQNRKYISINETEDDDSDKSQFKLKGNEKMKWFEQPPSNKTSDKSKKSYEEKVKQESNDLLNESGETKKIIRQYGKAGEVSSGSLLTLNISPSIFDEPEENFTDADPSKDDQIDKKLHSGGASKNNGDKSSKIKRKRRNPDTLLMEETVETKQSNKSAKSTDSTPSVTRSRKTSSALSETTSNEGDKSTTVAVPNDDGGKNPKRRFSQRVSSTSESKSDTPVKPGESLSKTEPKRKSIARR